MKQFFHLIKIILTLKKAQSMFNRKKASVILYAKQLENIQFKTDFRYHVFLYFTEQYHHKSLCYTSYDNDKTLIETDHS